MVTSRLHHEHDWCEEPHVDWDEDVFVSFDCWFEEITGSQYSERHDETFYNTGASCDATKTIVYELTIAPRDDPEATIEDPDMYEHVWTHHESTIEEEASMVDPRDPMKGFSLGGEHVGLGDDVVVVYTLEDVRVSEGWA